MERPYSEIRAANLRVAYEDHVALFIDTLQIGGGIIAVLGHNGAGKSTFIKTLLELLPKKGMLEVHQSGGSSSSQKVSPSNMAFCPETGSVFADITVESYVKFWCRVKKSDAKYYRGEGSRFIDMLSVSPLFKKLGRELSKGQRRRVQTAIGFICDPKLFLFDEPFDGLDVQRTGELAEILQNESENRSFIVSSHRMDVIERLADSIVVLEKGKVACAGSVPEVCAMLGGITLTFHNVRSPNDISKNIRNEYPKLIVNHVGSSVSITGYNLDRAKLSLLAQSESIEERETSLVDAMNFHLKSLSE